MDPSAIISIRRIVHVNLTINKNDIQNKSTNLVIKKSIFLTSLTNQVFKILSDNKIINKIIAQFLVKPNRGTLFMSIVPTLPMVRPIGRVINSALLCAISFFKDLEKYMPNKPKVKVFKPFTRYLVSYTIFI